MVSCVICAPPLLFAKKISSKESKMFRIFDAKMTLKSDENRNPTQPLRQFPAGTEKVSCSFRWENAEPRLKVKAHWYYVTEDIHILDASFKLTRRSERGVTSLTMPKGKPLPAGNYRLDFEVHHKVICSVAFSVAEQ